MFHMKTVTNLIAISFLLAISLACEDDAKPSVNADLKAYYPFDGDIVDKTGNYPTGNVTGATLTSDRNGLGDSAYYFNDYLDQITLGNILDDLKEPFTVTVWVKPESATATCVLTSQDNLSVYGGFYLYVGINHFAIMTGDGLGKTLANRRTKSKFSLPDMKGKWTHFAAVVKAVDDIDLYVNGKKIASEFDSGEGKGIASTFPDAPARVGQLNENGYISSFEGSIDEIKIWSRALSEAEVNEAMN